MRILPRRLEHGEEAPLVDHLGELRARIVFVLLTLAITSGVAFGFNKHILDFLNKPLPACAKNSIVIQPADGTTTGGSTAVPKTPNGNVCVPVKPVTTDITEPFLTTFWVALWTGILASLPIILWQVWGFFAPAFTPHVQRRAAGFALFAALLMVAGVAFGYFVVLDPAVSFLTNFNSDQFNNLIRAKSYYSFVVAVMVAVGVVFEMPIVILALTRIGIVPTAKLRRNRRIGYVIVAVIAVALPGVDPVTTTLEMLPLFALFEGSIWLSVLADRRWKAAAERRDMAFADGGDT